MLTMLCQYAADKGLPYEFVEWALDHYGHDADNYASIDAVARDWRAQVDAQPACRHHAGHRQSEPVARRHVRGSVTP